MGLHFVVDRWAALAHGLSTGQHWLDWFADPRPLADDFAPDLTWMPAGLRRRVSPLGRAALAVTASCQPAQPCPLVFASRFGDLSATAALLTQLHQEGVVSPMGFSLAVHNAAMGVYSIARDDRITTSSIAANTDLAEGACCEALGWLADGAPQVLVVCGEDPVPSPYQPLAGAVPFRHAWACLLRRVDAGGFSLQPGMEEQVAAVTDPIAWPTLRALAFLTGSRGHELRSDTGRFLWQRHD